MSTDDVENRPSVLVNALSLEASGNGPAWSLKEPVRDLDVNVVALEPNAQIDKHVGPDLDVLMHVVAGSGVVTADDGEHAVDAGALVWLPRRSLRSIAAAGDGMRYLTVHRKRGGLTVGPRRPRDEANGGDSRGGGDD